MRGWGLRREVNPGIPTIRIAMKTHVTPGAFRRAVYPTLGLSLPGLILVCMLFLGPAQVFKFAAPYAVQIVVGYLAMILVVETLGISLRDELCGYGAGIVFGIVLFLIGVLGGSASSAIVYWKEFDLRWVIGPLFWMGIYGVLPAAVFGLIGTGVLRKIRKETPPRALHPKQP